MEARIVRPLEKWDSPMPKPAMLITGEEEHALDGRLLGDRTCRLERASDCLQGPSGVVPSGWMVVDATPPWKRLISD